MEINRSMNITIARSFNSYIFTPFLIPQVTLGPVQRLLINAFHRDSCNETTKTTNEQKFMIGNSNLDLWQPEYPGRIPLSIVPIVIHITVMT